MPHGRKRKHVASEDEHSPTTRRQEMVTQTTVQQGTMISPGTMEAPKTLLVGAKTAEQATQQEQLIVVIVVERPVTALEGQVGVVAVQEQTVVLTALEDIHQPL